MFVLTLPARFTRDWLDSLPEEIEPQVRVLRDSNKGIRVEATLEALRDLKSRAAYYMVEDFDPEYRGLVVSARVTHGRLTTEGI